MAPLNAAAQMALANLLRGTQPQQVAPGMGAEMGPPPIDGALPGLPGMDGLSPQMALANALAGKSDEQSPIPVAPPPMGPAATPPPAGQAPKPAPDALNGMDLSAILSGDLERQRERAASIGRQRAAGNLGLLTGDRVLSNFGQAQLNQAPPGDQNSLRYLDLLQKQQRLGQQADAEDRMREQGLARLGYTKEQIDLARQLGWGNLGFRQQAHADELEENRRKAERQRIKDIQDTQDRLRGEFIGNKVIKDTQESEANFMKVEAIAKDPNPANDIALIMSVMKTYDPSSTVREGEFASAQNAAGVPDRISNAWDKLQKGTFLTPKQRKEFVESARIYLDSQKKKAREIASGYEKTARESGVDPRFVIPEGTISGYSVRAGAPRTTPSESMPTGADGNPTLDGGEQAPKPKAAPRPLNTEPFVYTRPATPKPGGVYMFNPKGNAFWVPENNADAARARGWKDVP